MLVLTKISRRSGLEPAHVLVHFPQQFAPIVAAVIQSAVSAKAGSAKTSRIAALPAFAFRNGHNWAENGVRLRGCAVHEGRERTIAAAGKKDG